MTECSAWRPNYGGRAEQIACLSVDDFQFAARTRRSAPLAGSVLMAVFDECQTPAVELSACRRRGDIEMTS